MTYPHLRTSLDVFNNGARRPSLGQLLYHLGRSKAVRMSEYAPEYISIRSGVYVGENIDGSLLYRFTSNEEHPDIRDLSTSPPATHYQEPGPEYLALVRSIIENPDYRPFGEVYVELGRLGAKPIQYFQQDIDITIGLFIGKKGDPFTPAYVTKT